MSNQDLIDFGIWRRMDEDVTAEETKQDALEASQGAIAELRDKGVLLRLLSRDVFVHPAPDAEVDQVLVCHDRLNLWRGWHLFIRRMTFH